MGLAERRGVKNFQDNRYPDLKQQIDQAAGFPVDVEVHWDSLGEEDYAHMYEEGFTKVYFKPLIEALKEITVDDLGKEALKDGLKKVIIKNTGSYDFSFKGGALTIDYNPVTNMDDWLDRKERIQKALEKGL